LFLKSNDRSLVVLVLVVPLRPILLLVGIARGGTRLFHASQLFHVKQLWRLAQVSGGFAENRGGFPFVH
jgi:hypothetical protein